MRILRIALRLISMTLLTTAVYVSIVSYTLLCGVLRGERWGWPATSTWRTGVFHFWAATSLRLLGVRVEVQGEPPRPPFFLVSNHLSYLDILVLASRTRCVFVAKADVADWPIFGALCRAGDTLFINRESKRDIPRVMARIRSVLDSGRGVIVFPEGSSSRGASVMRFRPPLLQAAADAGLSVSYAALSYRTPPGCAPAHLAVCWWGGMEFGSHVLAMLGLPRIQASLAFGEESIQESDRKALARRLQYAVAAKFVPVVSGESV